MHDRVGEHVANASLCVFTAPSYSLARMSSSVLTVPAMPVVATDVADPEFDPATSRQMGSIMYDQKENGYNLEWESRANFDRWLTHEQEVLGIEIRIAKTQASKAQQLYLKCETFRCTRNGCEGIKPYVKKTTQERKIESKWINGGCPCYVQIKSYPHTDTILGKYENKHSHDISKKNLKHVQIRVPTWDLIEDWVRYGVTEEEIVSDPLCDRS